jgi:hypothetical protein
MQNISKKLIGAIIVLIIAIVASGWFWYVSKMPKQKQIVSVTDITGNQSQQTSENQTQETSTEIIARNLDVSTWKTYRNEQIGIEFKYPPSWGDIHETREQSCLDFSDAKRKQLLNEKDPCLHISLSVGDSVFLATETPLTTKYGFPRGGGWAYKKGLTNSQDFCNHNPYTGYGLDNCHVFKTTNNIKVTDVVQEYPFSDGETMVAYYIHTPHPVFSDLVLSSTNLLASSFHINKKKYVSDESEMKLLIGSIHFIQ